MLSNNVKVIMPGKGQVVLKPTDHLATGGEGAVYLKNDRIYKIFLNPERARAGGMAEKINLLSQIKHPFIVSPIDVLHDAQHQVVGYYMDKADGVSLMKAFTNTWRNQNSFGDEQALKLVSNMRDAVAFAHGLKAIIVDGNETNYLVTGTEPRLIDVDSWKIGRHEATAIMPSIRDYHQKTHDEKSDWFSWGIVTFQVFTGIHPYKGTHPGFKKGDLEARMRSNASVFDKDIKLNSAVRDFGCIPRNLLDWYRSVFSNGERSIPPSALSSLAPTGLTKKLRTIYNSTGKVKHDRVHGFDGKIRHVSANGIVFYGKRGSLKAWDLYRKQAISTLNSCEIDALFENQSALVRAGESFVYLKIDSKGVGGRIVPGEKDLRPVSNIINTLPLEASKLFVIGNRVFSLNKQAVNGMVELELSAMSAHVILSIKNTWPVNVQSTVFFEGFGVMDCLGMPFIVLPVSESVAIHKASQLAEYKIINGFGYSESYVVINAIKRSDGQIYRLFMRLEGGCYLIDREDVVDEAELNISVSPKGIAVSIDEDGKITVESTKGAGSKIVADPTVSKAMILFSLPDGVYYYRDSDVYRISLS